jgi:hypothetical protein
MSMLLGHFASDARTLDAVEFRERHGAAFLFHAGASLNPPDFPRGTMVGMEPRRYELPLGKPQADWLVFPVRRTGRCPFPSMIAVGRAANNDVVLLDVSISKFHAYFKDAPSGDGLAFVLQDAGSRNGTFLGEQKVPSVKDGPAVAVTSGARIRFGHVLMTFVHAAHLRDMAARVSAT